MLKEKELERKMKEEMQAEKRKRAAAKVELARQMRMEEMARKKAM